MKKKNDKDNMGYIRLERKLINHWMYKDKPFNMSMAWIDMIFIATHTTHIDLWRGRPTEFKRGDVNLSITDLAKRWGWSRGRVRRFLNNLENERMVIVNATTDRTTITLVKYDDFQGGRTRDDTTDGQRTDNGRAADGTHLNNVINNDKGMNKDTPPSPWAGGADEYGPAPDGWDDEWEKDFMEDAWQNPGCTRAEWYEAWKDWTGKG